MFMAFIRNLKENDYLGWFEGKFESKSLFQDEIDITIQNNTDVAKEYEELKLRLWKKYEHNRDAYTNAKTELVKEYTEKARILYGNRY